MNNAPLIDKSKMTMCVIFGKKSSGRICFDGAMDNIGKGKQS